MEVQDQNTNQNANTGANNEPAGANQNTNTGANNNPVTFYDFLKDGKNEPNLIEEFKKLFKQHKKGFITI